MSTIAIGILTDESSKRSWRTMLPAVHSYLMLALLVGGILGVYYGIYLGFTWALR